jgi:hypothetical protein
MNKWIEFHNNTADTARSSSGFGCCYVHNLTLLREYNYQYMDYRFAPRITATAKLTTIVIIHSIVPIIDITKDIVQCLSSRWHASPEHKQGDENIIRTFGFFRLISIVP